MIYSKNILPKISVIIPTFNSVSYLGEAIDSVLAQNYNNLELIIVDDGSTDETKEMIKSYGEQLTYYKIAHAGAATARNYGVEHSTGDYLAFLDADDLWPSDKLNKQLDYLINQKQDAVFTSITQFIDQSALHLKIKKDNAPMPGICASTLLIRREQFLKIGYFKTTYQLGEFIEWFMRAKKDSLQFAVLDTITTQRRIHGNNTSLLFKANKKDYLSILFQGLKEKTECLN